MDATQIGRVLSDLEVADHLAALELNGFTVIKQLITAEHALELAATAENVRASCGFSCPPVGRQAIIANDITVNNAISYDEKFLQLALSGGHLRVIAKFLNDTHYGLLPKEHYNFILAQANLRKGGVPLPMHVDVRMQSPGPRTTCMQAVLAFGTHSKSDGCLRARIRSHLLSHFPDENKTYDDEVDIPLEIGDMVVFYSQLHHATNTCLNGIGPWKFLLSYRQWWIKPQYDFVAMLRRDMRDTYDKLTPNQKVVLGCCSIPSSDPKSSPSFRLGYDGLV